MHERPQCESCAAAFEVARSDNQVCFAGFSKFRFLRFEIPDAVRSIGGGSPGSVSGRFR